MILGDLGFIGRNLALRVDHEHWLINAAGRKDIAWCERFPIKSFEDNAMMPGKMAAEPNFIHIGSDHAYAMGEPARTIYARSKHLGDELVLRENPHAAVVVTGHVYAPDCPWIKWLDKELRGGCRVVAYTNRICCPTWIADLAQACAFPEKGKKFVLGRDRVNRYDLFRTYARVFGYDERLIVPGEEKNPLFIGDSSMLSDVPTYGIEDGFRAMKAEMEGKNVVSPCVRKTPNPNVEVDGNNLLVVGL